jgi:ABC-2 type transport system permease protein
MAAAGDARRAGAVAVDGLDAMTWRGIGLTGAILPTLMLLAFAALFGGVAAAQFRWEESA